MSKDFKLSLKDINRFWSYVDKKSEDDCWIWLGSDNGTGYGKFWLNYKTVYAHRVSYFFYCESLPENGELDHLCRNRRCVNPKHLEPVSSKENKLRGVSCSAENARKTHCIHGHLLSNDNLDEKYLSRGCRMCKICLMENTKRSNQKRKERLGLINRKKLNDEKVIEILNLYKNNISIKELVIMFEVSFTTIYNVISNKSWKHITR